MARQKAAGPMTTGIARQLRMETQRESAAGGVSWMHLESMCFGYWFLFSTYSPRLSERWLSALPDCVFLLVLQKNPECEAVSNEEQRHDQSWNEVSRSQLPRRKPRGIGLVEGVHEIDRAPHVEDPRDE